MKLSPETQEHFNRHNKYLYDEALRDFSVFFTWLSEKAVSGFWYAVHVKHSGSRGQSVRTFEFAKDAGGYILGKPGDLKEFLEKGSHLFMPEQEGTVWLASLNSSSTEYSSIPDDLVLNNIRVWDVSRENKVSTVSSESKADESSAEEKIFFDNYLSPAWEYLETEKAEAFAKTYPEIVKADAIAHHSLSWIAHSLKNGKHQIVVDIVFNKKQTENKEMGIVVDEDMSSISFGENFEDFFSALRRAFYEESALSYVYVLSQKDEKTIYVKAWNIFSDSLNKFMPPEIAILMRELKKSDTRYDFVYDSENIEDYAGEKK